MKGTFSPGVSEDSGAITLGAAVNTDEGRGVECPEVPEEPELP